MDSIIYAITTGSESQTIEDWLPPALIRETVIPICGIPYSIISIYSTYSILQGKIGEKKIKKMKKKWENIFRSFIIHVDDGGQVQPAQFAIFRLEDIHDMMLSFRKLQ